jgi:hypothetical protein
LRIKKIAEGRRAQPVPNCSTHRQGRHGARVRRGRQSADAVFRARPRDAEARHGRLEGRGAGGWPRYPGLLLLARRSHVRDHARRSDAHGRGPEAAHALGTDQGRRRHQGPLGVVPLAGDIVSAGRGLLPAPHAIDATHRSNPTQASAIQPTSSLRERPGRVRSCSSSPARPHVGRAGPRAPRPSGSERPSSRPSCSPCTVTPTSSSYPACRFLLSPALIRSSQSTAVSGVCHGENT